MIPTTRVATHPGTVLLKEFLESLGVTQKSLAAHMGMPVQRLNEIVRGKRAITAEAAWLFSGAFKTSPEFWLNLQTAYDLSHNGPSPPIGPLVLN